MFQGEVGFQDFHRVLADTQSTEVLQIRQTIQEQDASDELVGMLHLVNRLVVLVLVELLQTPVLEHARMQEVLIDGGQFVLQYSVQIFDDFRVAFHGHFLRSRAGPR